LNVNNGQPAANPAKPATGKDQLPPLALAGKLAALQQTLPPSLTQKKENSSAPDVNKATNTPASGAKDSNPTSANTSAADSKAEPANKAAGMNAAAAKASTPKSDASNAAAPNMNPKAFAALNQNTFANAPTVNLPIFAALKQKKRKPKSKFFRIILLIIIAYLAFAAVFYGYKLYPWYNSIKKTATILISDYKKPSSNKRWPSLPTPAKTPAPAPSPTPAESPAPELPETSASPLPSTTSAEPTVPEINEQNPVFNTPAPPATDETASDAPAQPAPAPTAQDDITIPRAPTPPANAGNTSAPTDKDQQSSETILQGNYVFYEAALSSEPEQHQRALENSLKKSKLTVNEDGTFEVTQIDQTTYSVSNSGYKYTFRPETMSIVGAQQSGVGTCSIQGNCLVVEQFSDPAESSLYFGNKPKKETKIQSNSKNYTLSCHGSGVIKAIPGHTQKRISLSFTIHYKAKGQETSSEKIYHTDGSTKNTNSSNNINDDWKEDLTLTYIKISD
ncbi:MAG: hypothetical protein K6G50_03950, partial [bacterium]|nr:hypothetical protein [bacterium]